MMLRRAKKFKIANIDVGLLYAAVCLNLSPRRAMLERECRKKMCLAAAVASV